MKTPENVFRKKAKRIRRKQSIISASKPGNRKPEILSQNSLL